MSTDVLHQDTIVAIATGSGGAIAVIRVSGPKSISLCEAIFIAATRKKLCDQKGFTLHYGTICKGNEVIDDVLLSLFRGPHSYTGEDMVEISCHASTYVQQSIISLCIAQGARPATAGEFTLRAFLNGKMDLSQAESVADVIASGSRSEHQLATNQMRGGYSDEFRTLRNRLIELTSLLELELDFGEEDVTFADRNQLTTILEEVSSRIERLRESFRVGNILKNGVPVAIVGAPNAGKSTLLNALLNEERALVSDIAGTTRDVIEDTVTLGDVTFRFIDTAGIRETNDVLESMGIARTYERMRKAVLVLLVVDASLSDDAIIKEANELTLSAHQQLILVLNKSDLLDSSIVALQSSRLHSLTSLPTLPLSARERHGLDELTKHLQSVVSHDALDRGETIVFNARHYDALCRASVSVSRALAGLSSGLTGDLLSQDTRETLHFLGEITGDITTDDILASIFSKFCIGK